MILTHHCTIYQDNKFAQFTNLHNVPLADLSDQQNSVYRDHLLLIKHTRNIEQNKETEIMYALS